MKKIILIMLAYFLFCIPVNAEKSNHVNIYLLHSEKCSHCKEEIKFLEKLEKKYINVNVYKYEISDNKNKDVINKIKELYNIEVKGIPLTIIGDKYYQGYSNEKTPSKIVATVKYYSEYGYQDRLGESLEDVELPKKEILKNQISVDEYIKQNSSYNVILNIESNEVEINTSAALLGIKSSLSVLNLISLIAIIMIIHKIISEREKIIAYGIYGIYLIIFEILNYIIRENLIFLIICIIILIITTILMSIFKNLKHRIKYILIIGIIILLSIIKNMIGINELTTLKKILELNIVSTITTILDIIVYIFSYISINATILFIINKLINKSKRLVVKNN